MIRNESNQSFLSIPFNSITDLAFAEEIDMVDVSIKAEDKAMVVKTDKRGSPSPSPRTITDGDLDVYPIQPVLLNMVGTRPSYDTEPLPQTNNLDWYNLPQLHNPAPQTAAANRHCPLPVFDASLSNPSIPLPLQLSYSYGIEMSITNHCQFQPYPNQTVGLSDSLGIGEDLSGLDLCWLVNMDLPNSTEEVDALGKSVSVSFDKSYEVPYQPSYLAPHRAQYQQLHNSHIPNSYYHNNNINDNRNSKSNNFHPATGFVQSKSYMPYEESVSNVCSSSDDGNDTSSDTTSDLVSPRKEMTREKDLMFPHIPSNYDITSKNKEEVNLISWFQENNEDVDSGIFEVFLSS